MAPSRGGRLLFRHRGPQLWSAPHLVVERRARQPATCGEGARRAAGRTRRSTDADRLELAAVEGELLFPRRGLVLKARKARMSSLPASVTLSMPPGRHGVAILVNSRSGVSFSQCAQNPSPLSAGARSDPGQFVVVAAAAAGLIRRACRARPAPPCRCRPRSCAALLGRHRPPRTRRHHGQRPECRAADEHSPQDRGLTWLMMVPGEGLARAL